MRLRFGPEAVKLTAGLVLVTVALCGADSTGHSAALSENPARRNVLTNQGVVLLAQAGYTESFVIDMIHHKQTNFDVSAEGLAWLARNGLSERVVRAMVANARKEENTAVLPATVQLGAPAGGITPSAIPGGLTPGYMPDWAIARKTVTTKPAAEASVQVAVPVAFPNPAPTRLSWHVRDWQPEHWYVLPRMP
ncbi:MAG: hypothetical protein JNL98_19630 [Bryobacterales bacterium]|nr:hypothetical protein [Bryobacterales bacterium]